MNRHTRPMEIVSRGVFFRNGKILLCRLKTESWTFLPGGDVEPGETGSHALAREMREELGVRVKNLRLIGVIENHYARNTRHELGLYFAGTLPRRVGRAREDHITFLWEALRIRMQRPLYPVGLARALLAWKRTRKPFLYRTADRARSATKKS